MNLGDLNINVTVTVDVPDDVLGEPIKGELIESPDTQPRLGFATTRQLIEEVVARIECDPADSTWQARLHGACVQALQGESRQWLNYTAARWAVDDDAAAFESYVS